MQCLKKEFLKCIGTCKKEARESKHFLRMAARAVPELKSEARELWLEARALHLIFAKIWRSGKNQMTRLELRMTNDEANGETFATNSTSAFVIRA